MEMFSQSIRKNRLVKMKFTALAFVALLAGVCADPSQVNVVDPRDNSILVDIITSFIERIIEFLKENDYDPFVRVRVDADYTFPVNGIFSASAFVEGLIATGASNIVINEVSYEDGTILIDLTFPRLEVNVGAVAANVKILKRELEAELSGGLAINELNLAARGTLGWSGFLIDDLSLASSLGSIESELSINIFGRDVSDFINKFLTETLPETLKEYNAQINRLVARLLLRIVDRITP